MKRLYNLRLSSVLCKSLYKVRSCVHRDIPLDGRQLHIHVMHVGTACYIATSTLLVFRDATIRDCLRNFFILAANLFSRCSLTYQTLCCFVAERCMIVFFEIVIVVLLDKVKLSFRSGVVWIWRTGVV